MHCSHCSTVIDILEELTREMRAVQFPLSSRVSRKDCRPYPVGILTFGEFFFLHRFCSVSLVQVWGNSTPYSTVLYGLLL